MPRVSKKEQEAKEAVKQAQEIISESRAAATKVYEECGPINVKHPEEVAYQLVKVFPDVSVRLCIESTGKLGHVELGLSNNPTIFERNLVQGLHVSKGAASGAIPDPAKVLAYLRSYDMIAGELIAERKARIRAEGQLKRLQAHLANLYQHPTASLRFPRG